MGEAAQRAIALDQPVVVRDVGRPVRAADTAREALAVPAGARHLLLGRGGRGRARIESADCVAIDVDAMTHAAFVASVAIAAGRRLPEMQRPAASVVPLGQTLVVPTIAESRAAGRLVLVAEDDSVNQKVILRQLALLGFAAEVADDGVEALRLWRNGGHALLISDLHMPHMDGYTLAQTIRSEERAGTRMPILALTANALKGEASHARAAGMDEYLTKPIQLKALKAALETWMNANQGSTPPELPAATPIASASIAPVDISVLTGLVGEDRAMVDEVLNDYLESVCKLAPEMRVAQEARDMPKIASIAHKLKSSSRSIGALVLGDMCAELENAGRAGIRDAVDRCTLAFESELRRVQACLQDTLAA
jgi:CheY-like chemotaxis protein/HPt (histidine-containing phosphotransfer) domain-containing protein